MSASLLQRSYTALRQAWPYSDHALFAVGSWVVVEGTFWASNAILYYGVYNNPAFDKWKVRDATARGVSRLKSS